MATLPETATWTAGIYQLETSDPVMGGPDGIDNQQAKDLANRTLYLKEQVETLSGNLSNQLANKAALSHTHTISQIVGLEVALNDKVSKQSLGDTIRVVNVAPQTDEGVIYFPNKESIMAWKELGSWEGYASDNIGRFVWGTTFTPRANELEANGQSVSKTTYPALWAFVQANNLLVNTSQWTTQVFKFADLGNSFRLPDLRDMFIRASSSTRAIGTHQGDAIRNIKGEIFHHNTDGGANGVFAYSRFGYGSLVGQGNAYGKSIFDASTVVPTANENRPVNVALAPRIIAF